MTMTDPIADMLTRIRNASNQHHDDVAMPSSKLKVSLAKILQREGYIEAFEETPGVTANSKKLSIQLRYSRDRKPAINGVRKMSKPGSRRYRPASKVSRVLGGMGIAILTTNQGLLTDREAREKNVGGEVLCEVW